MKWILLILFVLLITGLFSQQTIGEYLYIDEYGNVYLNGLLIGDNAGALSYVSTSGTQVIETAGTFERLNEGNIAYLSDHLYDFTEDNGRLTYMGDKTIHITLTATLSIKSGENSQVTNFRIAKNGNTIEPTDMSITFTPRSKTGNTTLKWLCEVSTGNYYELYGTSDSNENEFDVVNAVFIIIKH